MVDSGSRSLPCRDLLLKLKSTVQNLLASQSAQGVWGTYGGLRRVCRDTEAILCHRLRGTKASTDSDGSYWQFVQGLKWLSPSVASLNEHISQHSSHKRRGNLEAGRAWLQDSVQNYTLVPQLNTLLENEEHLCSFYYADAFLCQKDYVDAMRLCFKALELNKPAILTDISPQLSRQEEKTNRRSSSLPVEDSRRSSQTSLSFQQHQQHQFSLPKEPRWAEAMGNKLGTSLEVSYSIQVLGSSQSLYVDASPNFSGTTLTKSGPDFRLSDASTTPGELAVSHTFTSESPRSSLSVTQPVVLRTGSNSSFEDVTADANRLRHSQGQVSSGVSDVGQAHISPTPGQPPGTASGSSSNNSSGPGTAPTGEYDYQYAQIPSENSEELSRRRSGDTVRTEHESVKQGTSESQGLDSDSFENPKLSFDSVKTSASPRVSIPQVFPSSEQPDIPKHPESVILRSDGSSQVPPGQDRYSHFHKSLSDKRQERGAGQNNPLQSPGLLESERGFSLYHDISQVGTPPNLTSSSSPTPQDKIGSETRSSGLVYIPSPLQRGSSTEQDLSSSTPVNLPSSAAAASRSSVPLVTPPPSSSSSSFLASKKMGHKRWVSDTSIIRLNKNTSQTGQGVSEHARTPPPRAGQSPSSAGTTVGKGEVSQAVHTRPSTSGLEPAKYAPRGPLTRPTEGQSLISYLTSQDFKTCATLEKENAHFHISEALIAAFESMKWNRMMKKYSSGRHSSSSSSSDEEIQELRQRIRIRKQEKFFEKGRPFPQLSDGQTDTATTSQSASSLVSSPPDFSSMSEGSDSEDEDDDPKQIDLTMSSDSQGNLLSLRSGGLSLSMASLYSEVEILKSNQQLERNSMNEEATSPGSAESIAITLLKKFSEKHLPKASELKWLVSERDAPQRLLPLPASVPVSPDDAQMGGQNGQTRLRGNLEWAPPRAQIIFSVHPSEKRSVVMSRQNFRCAGCGLRVDPAFVKRYRYCEYLGKYFCQCCHVGETSIIPGRVIERWDFSKYPVSTFSFSLLERMWLEPLFHVGTINPGLYRKVRSLEGLREARQQLSHLSSLLAVCKRDHRLHKELSRFPEHWSSNDDAYSMDDLMMVKSGVMLQRMRAFISHTIAHVDSCPLCQGLGFICGICGDHKVIFPFQIASVVSCTACQSCYHKECFDPRKCPKCIRLESRRKLMNES